MRVIDWIAVLGALAWTPHLFVLIRNKLTKPRVRVLTDRTVEIGFTTYGPIANLRLAFAVENKDIVVSDLKLKIRHENGDAKVFAWKGITQQVGKMTMPDRNVMPFEKEQSVLAIKLSQRDIEERFIRFQESSYTDKQAEYVNCATKKMSYLKSEGKYEVYSFLREQEMVDLYDFNKHAFSWRPGKYTMTIEISSPVKFDILDEKREFSLSPLDVERLASNKDSLEEDYKRIVIGEISEDKKIIWNWVNPTLL